MGRVLPGIEGVEVVAFDAEEGIVSRDARGWARSAGPDEVGLLIGRIEEDHPLFHYDGYASVEETSSRRLDGVFTAGDLYFDTGVLVRRDGAGSFWYEGRRGEQRS
jgi:citronellyl-CoA synthetase